MARSAGNWWRKTGAAIMVLALSACSSGEDEMSKKLAAAEAAAEKAVAAQRAAEKAAATAARIAPRPEPTVMADTPSFETDLGDDDNDDGGGDDGDNQFSWGGEGSTVTPEGVVIPGQGA